jgi:hypothetical protein
MAWTLTTRLKQSAAARQFLKNLIDRDWQRARPRSAALSGSECKRIWKVLSGEGGS